MTDLRKAAEMALEALENYKQGNSEPAKALRQALAQPEQKPVAWEHFYTPDSPFYTAPPKREWVGLTEERVDYLADKYAPPIHPDFTSDDDYWKFYQEIEAELKEKNGG